MSKFTMEDMVCFPKREMSDFIEAMTYENIILKLFPELKEVEDDSGCNCSSDYDEDDDCCDDENCFSCTNDSSFSIEEIDLSLTRKDFFDNYNKHEVNKRLKKVSKKKFNQIKGSASVINDFVFATEVRIDTNVYNLIRFIVSLNKQKDIKA